MFALKSNLDPMILAYHCAKAARDIANAEHKKRKDDKEKPPSRAERDERIVEIGTAFRKVFE